MGIIERRGFPLRPVLVLATVLSLALAACGGSAAAPDSKPGTDTGGEQPGATAAPAPGGNGDGTGNADGGNPSSPLRDNLKIIYTGSMQLVVADLTAAVAKGKASVEAAGGYIGASQAYNQDDRQVATITYRIPADRWEAVMEDLRGLATKVVAEETQATEVGDQIVDLEARIRNLRASEAALIEIAKGTGKVTDLLAVEEQLTSVRGQIEQLDAQRAQLEDQAAYGTLVVTFGLEIIAVQETAKGWDPAQDVDGALATLIGMGQTIVSGAIWFGIVWMPMLIALVLAALVVRFGYKRWGPKPRPYAPIAGWGVPTPSTPVVPETTPETTPGDGSPRT